MGKVIRVTLDKYLEEKNITRYRLSKLTGIDFQTLDRYYKNQIVRYDAFILAKICEALDCDIADLLECVDEEQKEP